MSGFEFIFSLFGLLLGLALAKGLGGLSRALKTSHRVRIGWPTALLGRSSRCRLSPSRRTTGRSWSPASSG